MSGSVVRAFILALGPLGFFSATEAGQAPAGPPTLLYFFVTPGADGGADGAKRVVSFMKRHEKDVKLRPVLLVHDWSALRTMSEGSMLYRTLKELQGDRKAGTLDIALYDEEGLALAERWEIRSVPAYVLVKNGKAHRTAGSSADLELLWECSK